MKDNDKASYHSLYRDLRPYHVLRWVLNELGRSFVFLIATGIGIARLIQQRLEEYAKETKPDSDKNKARQAVKIYIAGASN